MATAKIAAAIKSIPGRKENLRKALEDLVSHSSSLASFTLQWKDLEAHFSSIEKSIDDRFKALQAKETEMGNKSSPLPVVVVKGEMQLEEEEEAVPREELKSLCLRMDAKGLRLFISDNRKDLPAIRDELTAAIRFAPDPALLVLDAMDGFYPPKSKNEKEGETQINRRTCINLLERIQVISAEIKPFVREKAKQLALEWRGQITEGGDNGCLEAMGFLQLLASYGLVSEFEVDDLMDIFIPISRRKQAVNLFRNLGLTDKLPDLIQKLNDKGRQLDSVKFVYAFDVVDKFPPVPLLKAYIKDCKKAAQEVRKKGKNSTQAQNECTAKEMGALKSVLKALEEYKLESEYPRENIEKRIAQLEQEKASKKRSATAAGASSNIKPQQLQQQPNKRPRPSTSASVPTVAAHSYPPLMSQPQPVLAEPAYMGVAGSYPLSASTSLYSHVDPRLSGAAVGLGGTRSPPRSYLYSSESLAGTGGLYERPVTYSSYPVSGLPSSYRSSLYP